MVGPTSQPESCWLKIRRAAKPTCLTIACNCKAPNRLGLRITPGNHLGVYQAAAESSGRALPVVVLIGAPPTVMLAAAARLPLRTSELRLAAALQGQPVSMQACQTIPLSFPEGTEIVLEGEILPDVREPEGPFGDFMDTYLPVGLNHVLHVGAAYMRHRRALLWPAGRIDSSRSC